MKTKILSIIILAAISLNGLTQSAERKTIIQKDRKGIVQYVKYSNEDKSVRIPKTADEFFKDVLNTQTSDSFEKNTKKPLAEGYTNEQFDQIYNGVKVDGAGYSFHYRNGEMYLAHGNYIKIEDLNSKPTITAEDAKISFADYKKIPVDTIIRYYSELMIKEIPLENDTMPMLVYRIRLIAEYADNEEVGFVDAQTGRVVFTEPALYNVSAVGTFATRYSGSRQAHTDRPNSNSSFILFNNTRGATIHTYNLNGSIDLATKVELIDNDNNWTTAEHGASNNDMALDVHWAMQQIYIHLLNFHGRNSYDDNGKQIDAHIKIGNIQKYQDNSFYDEDENTFFFGEGHTIFYPLASVDVVAHEFGHAITQYQIGWNNQSTVQAEFCEGMSDIWAAIMKYRITPTQPTWHNGNQIMKNPSYKYTKNLQDTKDPKAFQQMENTFGTFDYNNSANPYFRSGIFSHWFYLLASGGIGVNGLGNNYSVQGVGMDAAEKLFVEAVFNNNLNFATDYNIIRNYFVIVAKTLENNQYGMLAQQVEQAWYAVGVGSQPSQITSITGPSSFYNGQSVSFTVNNPPANYTWTCSSNLSAGSASGNTKSFTANGSGDAWVSISTGLVQLNYNVYIYSFAPVISYIDGPETVELYSSGSSTYADYTVVLSNTNSPPYSYSFSIDGNSSYYNLSQSGNTVRVTFYIDFNWSFKLNVYAYNSNGSDYMAKYITFSTGQKSGSSPKIYPNPVSDILYIEIDQDTIDRVLALLQNKGSKSFNSVPVFDIRLYNGQNILLMKQFSKGGITQFNVSDLPDGLYYLHIYNGVLSKPEMYSIIVKH